MNDTCEETYLEDMCEKSHQNSKWKTNMTSEPGWEFIYAKHEINNNKVALLCQQKQNQRKLKGHHIKKLLNIGKNADKKLIIINYNNYNLKQVCNRHNIDLVNINGDGFTGETLHRLINKKLNADGNTNDEAYNSDRSDSKNSTVPIKLKLLVGLTLPIIGLGMGFVGGFTTGFIQSLLSVEIVNLLGVIESLSTFLSVVVCPISFHYDKKRISDSATWNPSSLYYLMFIPYLNIILSLYYLHQRKSHVGLQIE